MWRWFRCGLGQFHQARDDYERALELKPSFVEADLSLAVASETLREREKARQAYHAYLANGPVPKTSRNVS